MVNNEILDTEVVDAVLSYHEKLRLLKSIVLLKKMPERTIQAMAEFIKPRRFAPGDVVFKEGGLGMSMYFVASGRIRIYKRTSGTSGRELAIVGPGDFFGEMAFVDEVPRSASAAATESCLLFELFKGDLDRWMRNSAPQALQFFAALSHVMSKRLRNTSRVLTMHFDLSNLLEGHRMEAPEFVREALERVVSYLDGEWSAAAYLFSNGTITIVPATAGGDNLFDHVDADLAAEPNPRATWLDEETFHVALARDGKPLGALFFRAPSPVLQTDRDELALILAAVADPIRTGLEMINLRAG